MEIFTFFLFFFIEAEILILVNMQSKLGRKLDFET